MGSRPSSLEAGTSVRLLKSLSPYKSFTALFSTGAGKKTKGGLGLRKRKNKPFIPLKLPFCSGPNQRVHYQHSML